MISCFCILENWLDSYKELKLQTECENCSHSLGPREILHDRGLMSASTHCPISPTSAFASSDTPGNIVLRPRVRWTSLRHLRTHSRPLASDVLLRQMPGHFSFILSRCSLLRVCFCWSGGALFSLLQNPVLQTPRFYLGEVHASCKCACGP